MVRLIAAPAPRPCESCPYRTDVPSGVWSRTEYEKLRGYDGETGDQPHKLFLCHQFDLQAEQRRVCSGWAGCHDGGELLALRIALMQGSMTPEDVEATRAYASPVPLFETGTQAAEHGLAELDEPGQRARELIAKIVGVRGGLEPDSRSRGR